MLHTRAAQEAKRMDSTLLPPVLPSGTVVPGLPAALLSLSQVCVGLGVSPCRTTTASGLPEHSMYSIVLVAQPCTPHCGPGVQGRILVQ